MEKLLNGYTISHITIRAPVGANNKNLMKLGASAVGGFSTSLFT